MCVAVPHHPMPDTTLVCFMACHSGLEVALRVNYPFLCFEMSKQAQRVEVTWSRSCSNQMMFSLGFIYKTFILFLQFWVLVAAQGPLSSCGMRS